MPLAVPRKNPRGFCTCNISDFLNIKGTVCSFLNLTFSERKSFPLCDKKEVGDAEENADAFVLSPKALQRSPAKGKDLVSWEPLALHGGFWPQALCTGAPIQIYNWRIRCRMSKKQIANAYFTRS